MAMTLPPRFPDRMFQLWQYSPSFDRVLFRSQKEDMPKSWPTRIDVLFYNVRRLNVETVFRGMEITVLSTSGDQQIYQVKSDASVMTVDATRIEWLEDDGEYHQPSPLMSKF